MSKFKHDFQVWLCAIFGVYSQDFYEVYQFYIDRPEEYRQQELSSLFWSSLNLEWNAMQLDSIAFQKEFNSFGELK